MNLTMEHVSNAEATAAWGLRHRSQIAYSGRITSYSEGGVYLLGTASMSGSLQSTVSDCTFAEDLPKPFLEPSHELIRNAATPFRKKMLG